jgi:aspartate carbamoyltransferase regulatory subunit
MRIERITNGIVLDHIVAGVGIDILNLFPKDLLKTKVDYASFVESPSMGQKDIIKIENLDVASDVLTKMAILSPNMTIAIIRDGGVHQKFKPEIPEVVEGVLTCKNPKCVTRHEPYLTTRFFLSLEEKGLMGQCAYCEHLFQVKSTF